MRKLMLIAIVLLIINFLICASISSLGIFSAIVSSLIIIATIALFLFVYKTQLKDGFKISLCILLPFVGLIQYFLSLVMPPRLTDNWALIIIILLLALEVVFVTVVHYVSNKFND